MGSFYLVNLILAIVAMSYDEQQKQDQLDEEAEEENQILMAVSCSLLSLPFIFHYVATHQGKMVGGGGLCNWEKILVN